MYYSGWQGIHDPVSPSILLKFNFKKGNLLTIMKLNSNNENFSILAEKSNYDLQKRCFLHLSQRLMGKITLENGLIKEPNENNFYFQRISSKRYTKRHGL